MAKKQSDYLAGILTGEAIPAADGQGGAEIDHASAASRAGLSLLGRENALSRVASGEVRQVTQLQIDPARVRVWPGNARLRAHLSEDTCRDLIDSLIAEGGQKVPAVVRHISGDPDHDYELIVGTRRHFAITWLRAHSYPEMRLLAQVADLDDEAAFRLADIENRARQDISDMERARNYAEALERHYGGKAVRMAERLRVSKGWLSKMLKAASLPDVVLAAFPGWHGLTLNPAYRLAIAIEDAGRARGIIAEAQAIAREQARREDAALPPLPAQAVVARLLAAPAGGGALGKDWRMTLTSADGRTLLEVKSVTRRGVTVHLPMGSGAGDDQLTGALRTVLETLRANGISLA